ncbi:MAG: hypothetical protein KCHDKBKB_01667 [Elusimicrobia bacterium]|nr:hypothetical protein [Elusimicrobiota bacterium]
MDPISVEELKNRLKKERTVRVCDLNFRIRRSPLLLLADENEDLWALARRDKEALSGRIKDLIANPTLPRMKRVLLAGVVSPKLAHQDDENTVCVDYLLAHHELAAGLFIEILNFSFEPSDVAKEG